MKKIIVMLLIALLFIQCGNNANRDLTEKEGIVVRVLDGDTYDILINGKQTRIRCYGIDAPEKGMDYHQDSKVYLERLCNGNNLRIEIIDTDRYGRTVAKSYLPNGSELGEEMVKAGMAWHYKKFAKSPELARLELEAKTKKLGLWTKENPITPPLFPILLAKIDSKKKK